MAESSLHEVRLLGSVEVIGSGGAAVGVGSRKQRALLVILALARGQVVSADRLIDELWGGDPPERAVASLYSYVSNLRQILEPRRDAPPSVLVTVPPGYVLRATDDAVDVRRFEQAAVEVSGLREEQRWSELRARADQALSWWRGPALGEFAAESFAALDAVRLEELRLVMFEDLCEGRVEMNDGHVIADLDRFVSENPLRERAWALLMRALYADGRHADALRTYQRARSHLMDQLGVEPGPQLRELERAIRHHDDQLRVADLDGLRTAPPATEPLQVVSGESHDDATRPAPMIGRVDELRICREVLGELSHGPRAIIVEGEPGIGKTRLVEEVAAAAEAADMLVLWGRSPDAGTSPAFWTWLPPLRALMELDDRDHEPHPGLATLLSSNPSETRRPADTERFALFDAVVALIERVTRRRRVMIVLDDLQWADPASLELAITLATRLSAPGVLLAVTTRDLDVGRNDIRVATLAALTRMAGSRRLKLTGLDPDDTAELLGTLTDAATEPAVADSVFDRAEGNPFFTIEIARLISHTAPTPIADQLARVPHGIRDVIVRRLDPMPTDTLDLLRTASVIGREFDAHLLATATGRRDLLHCLETLEPAVLQRIVVHIDQRPGSYRFAHALVREVLLGQTPLHLAKAHLAIADALDTSDDTAEILAEHLWAAAPLSETHRTASQLERAAHVAMSRGAHEAAQRHLERAANLYHSSGPAGAGKEMEVLTLLASLSVFHTGFAAVDSPVVRRARALLAHASDSTSEAGEPQQVMLRMLEFASLNVACDFATADPIAHELRAVAEAADDPLIRSMGHSAYGSSCWYHGRFPEAAAHLQMAIETLQQQRSTVGASASNALAVHAPAAILLHIRDMMGEADDITKVRMMLPDDPLWALTVAHFASLGALMVGDRRRAIAVAKEGISHDPHSSFRRWSVGPRVCLAAAQCGEGDAEVGRATLESLAAGYVSGTQRTTMSIVYATLAIGLVGSGDHDLATDAATLARAEITPHTDLYTEPLVLAAEAMVAATGPGGLDTASRILNRALVITERQRAQAVTRYIHETARRVGHDMSAPPEALRLPSRRRTTHPAC